MVTTNFTISGDHVECIARLDGNRQPVFDLVLRESDVEILRGADYKKLLNVSEAIREELGNLATYWQNAGAQVADFHRTWCKEGVPE